MRRLIFVILWACFLTTAAFAQFDIDPITFSETDCTSPALASSTNGLTMMGFEISGEPLLQDFIAVQPLMTLKSDTYYPYSPLVLGSGYSPSICWAWDGFHLAFVSGPMILLFRSDSEGNWDSENYTMLEPYGPVRGIELLGTTWDSGGPQVYLAVHSTDGAGGQSNRVQMASYDENGWSDLELLDWDPHMIQPELTLYIGAYTPTPQLFYLGGEDSSEVNLKSSILIPDSGWSDPVLVSGGTGMPSPIANEFDVTSSYGSGDINILGLGMQPTCPCGSVYLHSYISVTGSWQVDHVTEQNAYFDWPMSPKVAGAYENFQSHAFWYQEAVSEDFTPFNRTLEYRTIENGVMTDEGDFLDGPGNGGNLGSRVALSVDHDNHPVLAWTRTDTIGGVPQPEQIWVARNWVSSAVPNSDMNSPLLNLTAWPNPFNPMVNLAFELDRTQAVQLDIFDTRGRRVAHILNSVVNAGPMELTWSAKDDSGRKLPSGVYFARLISSHEKAVLKLVLAE